MKIKGLDIQRLGHDTFKIKGRDVLIYTDPYLVESGDKADLLLISHKHKDHCDLDSIAVITRKDTEIVGSVLAVEKIGRGKRILPGEKFIVHGIEIKGVPAYNVNRFRTPGVPFHPKESKMVGFVFTIDGVKIYFAGDTGLIPEMGDLAEEKIDIAFLPISDVYVMDEQEAAEAVKRIKPKIVIPMHYGTLPQVKGDPEKFKQMVGDSAIVHIL